MIEEVFPVRLVHRNRDTWWAHCLIPPHADVKWECGNSACGDPFEPGWIVLRERESDLFVCSQSCARMALDLEMSNH